MSYCLISWGANSHSQLGQDIQSEECVLARETDLSRCSLQPESIKKIVGGAGHTLILDNHGHVYSCGWNNKGQAGFPINESTLLFRKIEGKCPKTIQWTHEPFELAIGRKIKRVSIGLRHTALVTEDRKVLVAGSGNKGQLGLSPSEKTELFTAAYAFTEIPTLTNIQDVVCGQHHTNMLIS
ncbi:secretion-regulating guanine nucleotide exchange factor-like [Hylaeus volcanicus]|uniref:secretion-regulating guanine nucleotide exchange factor-like n=1 Tax=Hylaeus volcanicus TaxID=313075 RepID=UPI0023B84B7B|nr:secretion-regulating guanine nucleotide exchange factor-like [Hylaeus volcanicus]